MLATLVALLAAATVAVPLTRRFGLGSVLGYLLAGVVIGPFGLRLVSDINQIADKLHQKVRDPQGQSVYLRADENVPFGAFATVMDAVKQSGITNVSIVTQPLDQNGSKR